MKNPTQHEKIIDMCSDGKEHCQIEFWELFIRSPHKRRKDIEEGKCRYHGVKVVPGMYQFVSYPCVHGVKNGFDYKMISPEPIKPLQQARLI